MHFPSSCDSYLHAFGLTPVKVSLEAAGLGTFKDADRGILKKGGAIPAWWEWAACFWPQTFGREPGLSLCLKASQGIDMMIARGLSKMPGKCPLHGSTYFLPFLCPPSIERTQQGLAGALRLWSDVGVALGLAAYLACSHLTAHISSLHALATGHRALRRQECVSESFGSLGVCVCARAYVCGRGSHRSGECTPNPMPFTGITRISNFQCTDPK